MHDRPNLKVHFAAVENVPQFLACVAAKVNFSLFTVYPFIAGQFGLGDVIQMFLNREPLRVPHLIEQFSKHVIMDSGLFTLMFGAKGGSHSHNFIERWQAAIVEFVLESGYTGTMVEVDCQKVLTVEAAWVLRERLRRELPHNRQINVYHYEDGYHGLDRLIEFSSYIAISIPEMRVLKRSKYNICKLVDYIKNKRPELDIHLLGCTDLTLLKALSFCTSSDSTSWKSSLRYGNLETLSGKVHIREFFNNTKLRDEYYVKVYDAVEATGVHLPVAYYKNLSALTFAAEQLKYIYADACGKQE